MIAYATTDLSFLRKKPVRQAVQSTIEAAGQVERTEDGRVRIADLMVVLNISEKAVRDRWKRAAVLGIDLPPLAQRDLVKEKTLTAIQGMTKPGEAVPMDQLSEVLGINRNATRKRVWALRQAGLLDAYPEDRSPRRRRTRHHEQGYANRVDRAPKPEPRKAPEPGYPLSPPITPNRVIRHVKVANQADPQLDTQPQPGEVWGRLAPLEWRPWLNDKDRLAYPAKDAAAYIKLEYDAVRRGSWQGTTTGNDDEDEGNDE